MEETKNVEKKKLGVPATILLTLAAALGCIVLVGIVYAIFTVI